jgi:hypothetical protein
MVSQRTCLVVALLALCAGCAKIWGFEELSSDHGGAAAAAGAAAAEAGKGNGSGGDHGSSGTSSTETRGGSNGEGGATGGTVGTGGTGATGGAAGTGNIHVKWTLSGGAQDCVGADVKIVRIGDGTVYVPCEKPNGDQSTLLADVPAGDYTVKLSGGASGGSKTVMVEAGKTVEVTVDLVPAPKVTLEWGFKGTTKCADIGATDIEVLVDGRRWHFPCVDPDTQAQQGTVGPIGNNSGYSVTALGEDGTVVAKAAGSITGSSEDVPFPVLLDAVDATTHGDLELTWSFQCVSRGTEVVNLKVGDEPAVALPCIGFGSARKQASFPSLPAGATTVWVSTGIPLTFTQRTNENVTIVAGQTTTFELRTASQAVASGYQATVPYLIPTFSGKSCKEAGVSQVELTGTTTNKTMPCDDDKPISVGYSYDTGGFHPIGLSAIGTGVTQYQASGTYRAASYADTVYTHVDLVEDGTTDAGEGDVELEFTFTSFPGFDCAEAGLDTVEVFLADQDDEIVPGSDVSARCSELPMVLTGIPGPATYSLSARGLTKDGQVAYWTALYDLTVTANATSRYAVTLK